MRRQFMQVFFRLIEDVNLILLNNEIPSEVQASIKTQMLECQIEQKGFIAAKNTFSSFEIYEF